MTTMPARTAPMLRRAFAAAFGQALGDGNAEAEPLRLPRAVLPRAPSTLAQAQGGTLEQRRQAEQLYLRCLATYRERVQRGAGGTDEAGQAAAYFVLANLAAVQQLDPETTDLARITQQMRRLLAPAWTQMSTADRQTLFEQLALVGVLVGEAAFQARGQGAAAQAKVGLAARAYLQQIGCDADRLRLTPQGLALVFVQEAAA
jgi:hypothetical protein